MKPDSNVVDDVGVKGSMDGMGANTVSCTMNLCEGCWNMRHDERKEPNANRTQWKPRIGEKKLAVGVVSLGFEHKIMDIYAGKKICAKNMLKEAANAMRLCKEWLNETPHKE